MPSIVDLPINSMVDLSIVFRKRLPGRVTLRPGQDQSQACRLTIHLKGHRALRKLIRRGKRGMT